MNTTELRRMTERLVAIPKNWRALLEQRMEPFGLSQAKWLALYKLSEAGHSLPQVELAARIGIEPATLVRLLDRMEAEGWISRCADPDDRRCKQIALCPQAEAVLPDMKARIDQLRREVLNIVEPTDLAVFERVLGQLEERLATLSAEE